MLRVLGAISLRNLPTGTSPTEALFPGKIAIPDQKMQVTTKTQGGPALAGTPYSGFQLENVAAWPTRLSFASTRFQTMAFSIRNRFPELLMRMPR